MPALVVDINPSVLRWAREEAGFKAHELAEKLEIPSDLYERWESEGRQIPYRHLRKLAGTLKRQAAVFFLHDVPGKVEPPKDFRNLSAADGSLSPKVRLVLRRVSRFQELALELRGESYWKRFYEWKKTLPDHTDGTGELNERTATWLRRLLNIDLETQTRWKSASEAYREWRNAIEQRLGILVFQFSMPMDEVHGFSIQNRLPHAIVTNSNHAYHGRLFTLFHELGHILRKESGICIVDELKPPDSVEWACNRFAGAVLLPESAVTPLETLDEITAAARRFRVSTEAYLRRMKNLGLIDDAVFFPLLKEIRATYQVERRKTRPQIPPERKSRASRGETFYHIVLDAAAEGRIDYSDAADVLGLPTHRLVNEL